MVTPLQNLIMYNSASRRYSCGVALHACCGFAQGLAWEMPVKAIARLATCCLISQTSVLLR